MANAAVERFEGFTTTKIQVVIFRVLTPCSDVVGYERFGRLCFLHLQGEVKLVSYQVTTRRHNPEDHDWSSILRTLEVYDVFFFLHKG
jgi:hypothetical protein